MKQQLHIVVIGANGGTGKEFTQQALDAGHRVTAIVRTPEKLVMEHPNLKIVKGDVLQASGFENEIENIDVIISALGVHSQKPTTIYSQGITNIISAMKNKNIKRIFCISAQAIEISPAIPLWQKIVTKYILQRIFKNTYEDTRLMEQIIKQSNLDFTIMRPPMLKDKPFTGKCRFAINAFLKNPVSI
jgi:putative NADH-flavin reductase